MHNGLTFSQAPRFPFIEVKKGFFDYFFAHLFPFLIYFFACLIVFRTRALQLCEWDSKENGVLKLIDSLEQSGDYTRAAGIAVFNLRIRRAIDCLIKGISSGQEGGGDSNYSTVAMALSGYSGERNSLWREMCQSLRSVFTKPYLKAIFSFLTSDIETYEEILVRFCVKMF